MSTKAYITFLLLMFAPWIYGQEEGGHALFVANQGQWKADFEYKLRMKNATLFFHDNGYTSVVRQASEDEEGHHHATEKNLTAAAYRVKWLNSREPALVGNNGAPFYHNYFMGKDSSRWRGNVKVYEDLHYQQIYSGIDIKYYSKNGQLKYDIILAPGSDLSEIRMGYEGIQGVSLEEDHLKVETGIGEVEEWIPYSYQIIDGQKTAVNCRYALEGGEVSFKVDHYDPRYPLIIDPVLEFSTFNGSPGKTWGFTATYNSQGEFYGGGAAFNDKFPTTTGVFQDSSQGEVDISINKFSADGSALLYSTFLGGAQTEVPHSLVVNDNDELYILGNSGSDDFPVSGSAFQSNYVSGDDIEARDTRFDYPQGSNIIVTKLNPTGTSLLASTYLGGSVAEGINLRVYKNYGDHTRGEVIILPNGNVAISSNSLSNDLPLSRVGASPTDTTQNAVIAVFNPVLSNLEWGSYFGGNDHETGYSLRTDGTHLFLGGATASTDITTGSNAFQTSSAGNLDGYVAKFNAATGQFITATYLGTPQDDQAFFIEVDKTGSLYTYGQSRGSMPVTSGKYSNPGSRQFVQKYNNDLSNQTWSIQIGSGQSKSDLVPTAFMIDQCSNIYLSGWNGESNYARPGFSTANTHGLPVSSDAFQSNTDGSDFYFMVLKREAESLLYGSYFGGNSHEHVDGGTSRFSPDGVIYQAACAGCSNSGGFPTTPNAYSPTKPNFECNFGAMKIDFEQRIDAVPIIHYDTDVDTLCNNLEVKLSNNSLHANRYLWDFGNGQTSDLKEPTVTYKSFGTYTISLIAIDTICGISDTNSINITHDEGVGPRARMTTEYVGCDQNFEVSFENNSTRANSYKWLFGDGNSSQLAEPVHFYADSGSYTATLIAYDSICNTADTLTKSINFTDTSRSPQAEILYPECGNGLLDVQVAGHSGRYSYTWNYNGQKAFGTSPELRVERKGMHQVEVIISDSLCNKEVEEVINFHVDHLSLPTNIPNIFTPNKDDKNDLFVLTGENCGKETHLIIFNRWGAVVYETYKPFEEFWDGRFKGREVPQGVYMYILTNGEEVRQSHLTLIR